MDSETQTIQQQTLLGRIILDLEKDTFLARGLKGKVKVEWVWQWEDLKASETACADGLTYGKQPVESHPSWRLTLGTSLNTGVEPEVTHREAKGTTRRMENSGSRAEVVTQDVAPNLGDPKTFLL